MADSRPGVSCAVNKLCVHYASIKHVIVSNCPFSTIHDLFIVTMESPHPQKMSRIMSYALCSLASHTLQSAGKETSRTTSCSGDRIWSRPIRFEILNLLLSSALLAARAHIASPACFVVTRDVFVIIAFRQNNSLYARLPDPLSLEIEGCG